MLNKDIPQGIILKNGKARLTPYSVRYGKSSYLDHKERYRDLVTDLNIPVGYKLTDGINKNWR